MRLVFLVSVVIASFLVREFGKLIYIYDFKKINIKSKN